MKNPLEKEFTPKSLLKFVFPSSAAMIFVALYSIIDGFFVARFINSDALAAINIVFPAMTVVMGIGIMLASGGSAIIAKKMGEGDPARARENFSLIMCGAITASCILAAAGAANTDALIKFFGASDRLFPYCRDYLKIIMLFFPAIVMQVMYEFFFVTAGRPLIGLAVTVAAGLTNAALDYFFIAVLAMGIKGAVWATAAGCLIPVITGTVFLLSETNLYILQNPRSTRGFLFRHASTALPKWWQIWPQA